MSIFDSSIYRVRIAHQRSRPKRHHLRYDAFYMLLDLDELDRMHRKLKWFSVNSFNLFSFFDRDHGPGSDEPLRSWVENQLQQAGISYAGGRIRVLCLPRILGYAFNPLTAYFCHDRDGTLTAILYEVSNTFGERHSYLFPIEEHENGLYRHDCEKRFYVSPFMNVEGRYFFRVRTPSDKLFLHIHQVDTEGPLLDAWVRGKRMTMSDRNLLTSITRFPFLTLKVMAGIHWEALQLWLKGVGLKPRPKAPSQDVTHINRQPR